jgi:hypothetical protein
MLHMQLSQLHGLVTIPQLTDPRQRGKVIEAEAVSDDYNKVITSENTMTAEEEAVCHQLVQALDLRWKWLFRPVDLPENDTVRGCVDFALCSSAAVLWCSSCTCLPVCSTCHFGLAVLVCNAIRCASITMRVHGAAGRAVAALRAVS